MKNTTRELMAGGGKSFGTFLSSGSPYIMEALGIAGLDYAVVDTEHGPFAEELTAEMVRAAKLRGITPFARVRDKTRPSILRMLDIGVEGLIVPFVHTVQEVEDLVSFAKYFPMGERGVAYGRGSGFGRDDFAKDRDAYFAQCNREQLLVPQCETAGCLENIEEIAAIEGVDGIFIGPADLSVALGKPMVFDDAHSKAIERILKACKNAGKFAFIFSASAELSRKYYAQGFDSVTQGNDIGWLINAAAAEVKAAKG